MSEWNKDGTPALDVELARLKDALRELSATDGNEQALRRAFRARRAILLAGVDVRGRKGPELATALSRSRALRRRATLIAGALAASIAIAAIVLVGFGRIDRAPVDGIAARTGSAAAGAANGEQAGVGEQDIVMTAFQPLSYSPEISPAQAYSIVRVRIPLTSLVGYGAPIDGMIEADLLVGEDGLARGIRFDTTDAELVSMVSQ